MKHPVVILFLILVVVAVGAVAAVSVMGIWGFGPQVTYARAIISRTSTVEGRYLVETSQGNFEVDRLNKVNFTTPETLFAELHAEQAYDLLVVGNRRMIFGFSFSPYIIGATVSQSNLPPNFRQILLEQGYESLPSSQLWVSWTNRSIIAIDPLTYTVLVGPAPTGVVVPVPSLTANRPEDLR